MGAYAFPETPAHARVAAQRHAAPAAQDASLGARRWNIPVIVWDVPKGFDSTDWPDNHPHHTLAGVLAGPPVTEVRQTGDIVASFAPNETSVAIQSSGQDWRFRCAGDVRYAHLYVARGLVRDIAGELFGGRGDRPDLLDRQESFVRDARLHALWARYLARALDEPDPPTVLEMDAHATLLGLHLVRCHSTLAQCGTRPLAPGGLAPWQLGRACDAMAAGLDSDGREPSLGACRT